LLEPLLEEGHKVLVFSQFVTMLDLLRENVKQRGWPHFYLAGETENRGELVRKFQSAKDGAVFLISLKAGGFGLNLTAASYVVLFDPWWNPAVENQAIDRTHRIGQSSKVMAYRLLVRDSVEQKIRALQKHKAALADDVLGEERFAQSLTREDLQFLFADGTGDSNKSVREFTDGDFHLGQRVGRSSSQNRKPAAEPCGNGGSTGVYSDDRGV
jgi:SNF2 family DNA or RNA helicase